MRQQIGRRVTVSHFAVAPTTALFHFNPNPSVQLLHSAPQPNSAGEDSLHYTTPSSFLDRGIPYLLAADPLSSVAPVRTLARRSD